MKIDLQNLPENLSENPAGSDPGLESRTGKTG